MSKHKSKVMNALKKRFKTVLSVGKRSDGAMTFLADSKPVEALVKRNEESGEYTTTIRIYQKGWVTFKKLTYK